MKGAWTEAANTFHNMAVNREAPMKEGDSKASVTCDKADASSTKGLYRREGGVALEP